MIVNTSYAAPAGGGQFPLKTVKFTNTKGYGSGGSYYLNAKDLIDSGMEFSTTAQRVLVTALLKKNGALVATFTAPFVYYITGSYYNVSCPSDGAATLVYSSNSWSVSTGHSDGANSNAASCTATYYINTPDFDEQDCAISYYLTEA